MTKKKRYCISLDKYSNEVLISYSKRYGYSYSYVVELALKRLDYVLFESIPLIV